MVAAGVSRAMSDKEIAAEMGITPGTVKAMLSMVYRVLQIGAYAVGSPRVKLARMVWENPERFQL